MKRNKFIIMGVIMATLLSSIFGCSMIDDISINAITKGLSEKYGKTFTIVALGDRYDRNTATAYVCADDDPDIRFVVKVNTDGKIVYDEYAMRFMAHKIEKILNDTFKANELEADCYVKLLYRPKDISISLPIGDFIKESETDEIDCSVIVKNSPNLNGEMLQGIYKKVFDNITSQVQMNFAVFILSQSDYELISQELSDNPCYFGIDTLRGMGLNDDTPWVSCSLTSDGFSETAQDMDKIISGRSE